MMATLTYPPGKVPSVSLLAVSLHNSSESFSHFPQITAKVDRACDQFVFTTGKCGGKLESPNDLTVARQIALLTNSTLSLWSGTPDISSSSCVCSVEIAHWTDCIEGAFCKSADSAMKTIEARLSLRTFLVGHSLSIADLTAYVRMRQTVQELMKVGTEAVQAFWTSHPNCCRLYTFLDAQPSIGLAAIEATLAGNTAQEKTPKNPQATAKSSPTTGNYEGKLPGAVMGKVITRFPPEPSGYLHIGHAKAALLNNYFARLYKGKLIVRFDDTNPAREKMEYEESILEDLKLLEIDADRITRTSDYFDKLQQMMENMIVAGKAYVDNTPTDQMRLERGEGVASLCRNQPNEQNLKLWKEMLLGSTEGQTCCVRAKIDMQHRNKCMRDPVMYRCVVGIPHHRHGTTYKAYPTYDFACPVVDAIEGVTHAMRTSEYCDRNAQYKWVLAATELGDVEIYEFSRLNFVRTVLSKRKLQWFVDHKLVTGWDDPRFPTVRGIQRRGLTVAALMDFLLEQGPSKALNLMEWDKLWTKNKQVIDPIVPRYMAVAADATVLHLRDGPAEVQSVMRDLHNKNPDVGKAVMLHYRDILIEQDDAMLCEENEEVTLMRWGNAVIDKIYREDGRVTSMEGHLHLEGDFKLTKKKLHWIPNVSDRLTPCILREYDHLISVDKLDVTGDIPWEQFVNPITQFDTEALGDPLLKTLAPGDIIQLERRGYFRVDRTYLPKSELSQSQTVLIKVPDGKSKSMSTVSTKVNAASLSGTKKAGKK